MNLEDKYKELARINPIIEKLSDYKRQLEKEVNDEQNTPIVLEETKLEVDSLLKEVVK